MKRYTKREKLQAIHRYVENDCNALKTATELKIPKSTICGWIDANQEYIKQYSEKIVQEKRERMAKIFVEKGLENSRLIQEKISEAIQNGTPIEVDDSVIQTMSKTSNYMGTMYDKYRLESGKSTNNVGLSLSELLDNVKGETW